jgi:ElaA protein
MIQFQVKSFESLTANEVYAIIHLRSEVFVVEQQCIFQDLDHKDQKALHVLGYVNNEFAAYARLFAPSLYYEEAAIGRFVVKKSYRALKLGHQLMTFCIHHIETTFKTSTIKIGAQKYLTAFYNTHGFKEIGDDYWEDHILHVHMIRR